MYFDVMSMLHMYLYACSTERDLLATAELLVVTDACR